MQTDLACDLTPLQSGLAWQQPLHAWPTQWVSELAPWPLAQPHWLAISDPAAALLGLRAEALRAQPAWLQALAGNRPIAGTRPLASAYSGHQFGHWAGPLGDGRALLLGAVKGWEVQLKGSGRTPYSRRGDGRAVLRSSIREFLASEAMAALGLPTTRALCLIGSTEPVRRERWERAAVLTRLAPSFLRFGHFEHAAASASVPALRALADWTLRHLLPECLSAQRLQAHAGNPYRALLAEVVERSAQLLAGWQTLGFCHGVMNTDNMSVLGLTLDYGPFQFLDAYDPGFVCNHTDSWGRYAFDQQPRVTLWNLYALAHALRPLLGDEAAIQDLLDGFDVRFEAHLQARWAAKLGLGPALPQALAPGASGTNPSPHPSAAPPPAAAPAVRALAQSALQGLHQDALDFTAFWRSLSRWVADPRQPAPHQCLPQGPGARRSATQSEAFWAAWLLQYQELLAPVGRAQSAQIMQKSNPAFVPRTHVLQAVIAAAEDGDPDPLQALLALCLQPFDEHPGHPAWLAPPPPDAPPIALTCSS